MDAARTNVRQRLEQFGNPRDIRWHHGETDYVTELGVTAEDIPDLLAIALQWAEPSNWPKNEDDVALFAPIHAWRCLAHLQAEEAVRPLLDVMDWLNENQDDWYLSEFPHVFGWIGPASLAPVADYLADDTHRLFPRVAAAGALGDLAQRHPETRDDALARLCETLRRFEDLDPTVNTFIIGALLDMKAVEAAELIERAHAADCVDITVYGNWEIIRKRLGVEGLGLVPSELANRRMSPFRPPPPPTDIVSRSARQTGMRANRDESATIRSSGKIGRNEPCPCGSGKKHKKCCGR
jgi:hypothetical protein